MGRTKGCKKKNYLDNEELKAEMLKCKESKVVSDKLARMFQLIVENVSRSFYWANPDAGEDCKATAVFPKASAATKKSAPCRKAVRCTYQFHFFSFS